MLATKSLRLVRQATSNSCRHSLSLRQPKSRTFVTSTLQTLSDGFLDLAIALPYPQSLPPYSSTIILVAVATRLAFTVPFSIWAKKRQWKAEEVAMPQLKQERPQIIQQVLKDMRNDGFRGNEEEAKKELQKRAKPILEKRRDELFKLNHCSPKITMLIPPVSQLPLFVGFSMMLSRISQAPTVLDSESFLTLTSLAHPDPTLTIPIVIGVITLANVESSRWFMDAAAIEREKKVAEWTAQRRAQGHNVLEPKKIIQSSLRVLAVGRILIAALVPGSIQVYWLTSATFGLLQSWIIDFWEARRRRMRALNIAPEQESNTKPTPVQAPPKVSRRR
ncbi:60Kd inner membrane protein-domain-containing protein [Abortiporus biennis]|nr:60Kd inner membrane protein-domain-containing protein [Abortiporus biennis]